MNESGYTYTLFDQAGRQVVDLLWLPSLEALLLGILVWTLLKLNPGFTPRVRHFLWVLVLVKPLLSVAVPWQGPFELPWSPVVLGGAAGATGGYYAPGSYAYAVAGLIWIAFAVLGLIRIIPAVIVMTLRKRRTVPVTVPWVRTLFDHCLAEVGVKSTVSLRVSDEFAGPALVALGRPVVVIPSWCIVELSSSELRQILLHELSHYARRDHLTVFLVQFARIFFFFHPAVWYASHRVSIEAERACDVDVIRVSRQPESYASTLLKVAGGKVRSHWQVALHLARSASLVALRIRDVLGSTMNQERSARFSLLTMAFFTLLAVTPLFHPAVETPVDHGVLSLTSDLPVSLNLSRIDPAGIPLDQEIPMPVKESLPAERAPNLVGREFIPMSMVDGRPSPRRTIAAVMFRPQVQLPEGSSESGENQKINPAVLGHSSAVAMLDESPAFGRKIRQGRIEVQGVGHTGNELFNPRTVSLSAGYFVTPTHQFGGVFSIRRPEDAEVLDDTARSGGTVYGANLLRTRKLAAIENTATIPGNAFEPEENEQVDQITRIGAFYRYNLPVPGGSFTPFLGCGTGLEIRPQNSHLTVIDAGVGLRYFWTRNAALVVQASYRKELDVTSRPIPEMSLGFSAIF